MIFALSSAFAQMAIPGTPLTAAAIEYEVWYVPSDGTSSAEQLGGTQVGHVWNLVDYDTDPALFLQYFEVSMCPIAHTTDGTEAVSVYEDIGIPFVTVLESPFDCYYTDDSWWNNGTDGQGAPLLDLRNQIDIVWPADSRFVELAGQIATTKLKGIEYRDETDVIRFDGSWEIIINGPAFTYLAGCPSEADSWDKDLDGIYQYDVVAHELLHVLGGWHISETPVDSQYHSVMQRVQNGGHFGTEAFGDPYDPDGAECGIRSVPLTDELFLQLAWPEYADPGPPQSRLYNWFYGPRPGGGWRATPVGWDLGGMAYLGAYCPGDELSTSAQVTVQTLVARFTRAGTGTSYVTYAGTSVGGWPPTSITFNNGAAGYDILGNGKWYETGFFDPPNYTIGSLTPGSSGFGRDYRVNIGLNEFGGGTTHLPMEFTIHPECSASQGAPCCGQ